MSWFTRLAFVSTEPLTWPRGVSVKVYSLSLCFYRTSFKAEGSPLILSNPPPLSQPFPVHKALGLRTCVLPCYYQSSKLWASETEPLLMSVIVLYKYCLLLELHVKCYTKPIYLSETYCDSVKYVSVNDHVLCNRIYLYRLSRSLFTYVTLPVEGSDESSMCYYIMSYGTHNMAPSSPCAPPYNVDAHGFP